MKKHMLAAILTFTLVFSLNAMQAPQQSQMKLEDVQRALSLVDKTQPVPEKYKAGFDSINANDTLAMLSYISSDWMEGRETGTRGYQMASEYAASMFKMWGIKPGGDMPAMGGRGGGRRGGGPAIAPQRSYFQEFALRSTSDVQSVLTVDAGKDGALETKVFQSGVDYQGGGRSAGVGTISAPVVFVGYGIQEPSIQFDELSGHNLKGKVVVVLTEAPGRDNAQSPFQTNQQLKDKYFPGGRGGGPAMAGPRGGGPGGQRFDKMAEIQKLEPAVILQVANVDADFATYRSLSSVRQPNDERAIINKPRVSLSIPGIPATGGGNAPSMNITRDIANAILSGTGKTIDELKMQIETTNRPASIDLPDTKVTVSTTAKTGLVRALNVIGYIEGSDPKLKDEYVVVGAHFDHLGKWEDYVYNGADDNGSGSIGVMNIARAFAMNPVKPKRSIVFGLWTGEEEGLLGSRYYTLNPTFPMDKTIGYLNYDMISRPYDETTIARSMRQYSVPGAEELVKRIRAPWFVTVNVTDGSPFGDIAREMNNYVGLDLALRGNPPGQGSGGSDHASFARVNKPFVYYMAAMTSDYHQPGDTVEKVSGELIAKVSQHGFLTIFKFADQ